MTFQVFEHTADIGLDVESDDLEGLFTDASRGLFHVVRGDNPVSGEQQFEVEAEGDDLVRLLVRFLNEFVFLMDAENVVFRDLSGMKVERAGAKWSAKATVHGEPFSHERHPGCLHVKAVTRHTAEAHPPGEGRPARARVILDV